MTIQPSSSRADRANALIALHQSGTFLMPNPWDAGSARILEQQGFAALASTSAGLALTRARIDHRVRRDVTIAHLGSLCDAVQLPIHADLDNGFGDTPDAVAYCIRLAAAAGVAGGSIEDATGNPDAPVYAIGHAVERIQAAVAQARGSSAPFVLTARAENFNVGRPDLPDTIRRLQRYQEAGADVLFAPGAQRLQDIRTILSEIDRPLNVMISSPPLDFTLDDLRAIGVRRISFGAALARAAYGALVRAAHALQTSGSLEFVHTAMPAHQVRALMTGADDNARP